MPQSSIIRFASSSSLLRAGPSPLYAIRSTNSLISPMPIAAIVEKPHAASRQSTSFALHSVDSKIFPVSRPPPPSRRQEPLVLSSSNSVSRAISSVTLRASMHSGGLAVDILPLSLPRSPNILHLTLCVLSYHA